MKNEFYKMYQGGFILISATLFNPITNEVKLVTIDDYDDDGFPRNYEVDKMEICKDPEVLKCWRRLGNRIEVGDMVKIIKGRKMINETKKVVKIFDYKIPNTYDYIIRYVVFEDNTKVNIDNCIML